MSPDDLERDVHCDKPQPVHSAASSKNVRSSTTRVNSVPEIL